MMINVISTYSTRLELLGGESGTHTGARNRLKKNCLLTTAFGS